jgi:hypothetical protein
VSVLLPACTQSPASLALLNCMQQQSAPLCLLLLTWSRRSIPNALAVQESVHVPVHVVVAYGPRERTPNLIHLLSLPAGTAIW